MLTDILKDIKLDPQPFNMARPFQFQENLRSNLTGINDEREQTPTKIVHFTRSSTGNGTNLRKAKLEEKIALLEALNGRSQLATLLKAKGGGHPMMVTLVLLVIQWNTPGVFRPDILYQA